MNNQPSILIVEDEDIVRRGLTDVFVFHGYKVETASTGTDGLSKALANRYSAVILDVMLPEIDGYTICEKIRAHDREQPIIMLTAKGEEDDVLAGLSLGADDYVTKPFSVRELLLRVEAVLRRSNKGESSSRDLTIGDLKIDTRNLNGSRADGPKIEFTRREVDLLQYLHAHRDRPVSRDELLSKVWDYDRPSQLDTRTVDIHIAKIRRKIEADPKEPVVLVTIRGEGYKIIA